MTYLQRYGKDGSEILKDGEVWLRLQAPLPEEIIEEMNRLAGFAALATDEWGGTDEECGTWEEHTTSAEGKHVHCIWCNGTNKHLDSCRKARFDALSGTAEGEG